MKMQRKREAAFAGHGGDLDLRDNLDWQPTFFYLRPKEFFENGVAALEQRTRRNNSAAQE